VPKTGQAWTTLLELKEGDEHLNKCVPFPSDPRFINIWTEPKVSIGQRCILIRTPAGNVLWDCITYLDQLTIDFINGIGGLAAIVISHPHFYTTHLLWADVFKCPIYLAAVDKKWLSREDLKTTLPGASEPGLRRFVKAENNAIIGSDGRDTGVRALKLGGHFPGSLVALFDGRLLLADTMMVTPSGLGHWGGKGRPRGMTTFAFMWSYPNVCSDSVRWCDQN
jgi:glyoxylase-like metal-dependent hydrolase (beta-lactamase superfamily II)